MAFDNYIKERIALEVIKTLVSRFSTFPDEDFANRNAPFHEAFLQAFSEKMDGKVGSVPMLLNMSSWLHGLNTTLGQAFFEDVARILCNGEKREYTSKKLGNLPITLSQQKIITQIVTDLSNKSVAPNLTEEDARLFQRDNSQHVYAMDFSADVFFERGDDVVAIELKTVKPNSGGSLSEKQKILTGKSALHLLFPDKHIRFFLGFPFDPTVNPDKEPVTGYDKPRFLQSIINLDKFFANDEILLASELWDYLSEQGDTMGFILEVINSIATPRFLEKYQLLANNSKRQTGEYRQQLSDWFLFSELTLLDYSAIIQNKIAGNKKLQGTYKKIPFDNQGNYQWERFNTLSQLFTRTCDT